MQLRRRTFRRATLVALWLGVSGAGGCGRISEPTTGSESHFLHYCRERCDDGLECISGLCTQACSVGSDAHCRALSAVSVCTNESIEPGQLAVCDVACSDARDCAPLSRAHSCTSGFCRAPLVDPELASGGSGQGGSGSAGSNVGGGASSGGASASGAASSADGGSGQTGGADAGGGSGADGGSGQGGSVGGALPREPDGFPCEGGDVCAVGAICTACRISTTTYDYRCTPHPTEDPSGFAASTSDCLETVSSASCDGPEDCPASQVCQADVTHEYSNVSCSEPGDVCAPYAYCRSCHTDADCDAGFQCLARDIDDPTRGTACGDTLPMLLARGDWLIGWSGGLDHFNWFRFMPSAAKVTEGTVQVQGAPCLGCTDLLCHEATGTYTVLPNHQVNLEFASCGSVTFTFRTLGLPTFVYSLPVRVEGVVMMGEDTGLSATMYDRGVACELDFSACAFPPPRD